LFNFDNVEKKNICDIVQDKIQNYALVICNPTAKVPELWLKK